MIGKDKFELIGENSLRIYQEEGTRLNIKISVCNIEKSSAFIGNSLIVSIIDGSIENYQII